MTFRLCRFQRRSNGVRKNRSEMECFLLFGLTDQDAIFATEEQKSKQSAKAKAADLGIDGKCFFRTGLLLSTVDDEHLRQCVHRRDVAGSINNQTGA